MSLLGLLISLLILVLILGLVWWIISLIPIPPPMVWVVRVIFAVICLIIVIAFLSGGLHFPILVR